MHHAWAWAGGWLLAAGLGAMAADTPRPSVKAVRFETAPRMDGRLDDPCWKTAARIELGRCLFSTGAPPVKTDVRIGYDTNRIYFAFTCPVPPGAPPPGQRAPHDFSFNAEDRLELFLNASGAGLYPYAHFTLGSSGARLCQRVLASSATARDPGWRVGWQAAIDLAGDSWTAEIAIPAHILREADGLNAMPFNVTRTLLTRHDRFLTWAPVGGTASGCGFHDPERFGRLEGLEALAGLPPACDPVILGAGDVTPYREESGDRFSYSFKVTLGNLGGRGGDAVLVIEDQLPDGPAARHEHPVRVPETGTQDYTLTIPVTNLADHREARVALASQADWQGAWTSVKGTAALVTLTAYPNLSVYTGEPEGRLTIGCAYGDTAFREQNLTLRVTLTNDALKTARTLTFKAMEHHGVVWPFETALLKDRSVLPAVRVWPVTVELLDAGNRVLATAETCIRVAPPPPVEGLTVSKIDHERMCLLVNGAPFFPIGFMTAPELFTEPVVSRMKEAGMNHMVYWMAWGGALRAGPNGPWDQRMNAALDAAYRAYQQAQARGMYVMAMGQGQITTGHNEPEVNFRDQPLVLEKLPQVIGWYKNLPNLLAWQGVDEIDSRIFPLVREQRDIIRAMDPHHVVYSSARGAGPWIYDAYDVPGMHAYWGPDSSPLALAALVRNGAAVGKMRRSPVFATPQAQRLTYHRDLTPDERRAGIWLPLIYGAKGIQFFMADGPFHDVTWRVFAYTAREINALAPILLEDRPPQAVVCTAAAADQPAALPPLPRPRSRFEPSAPIPFSHDPARNDMPLVHAMVHDKSKAAAEGELIVLCNGGRRPLRVRCALSSLGAKTRLRGYFDGRAYACKDGAFSLELEPYGLRILETLHSTRQPDEPVALGIAAVPGQAPAEGGEAPRLFKAQDRNALRGGYAKQENAAIYTPADDLEQVAVDPTTEPGRNAIRNSSFEEAAYESMPDHWISYAWQRGYLGVRDPQAYHGRQSLLLLPGKRGTVNVNYQFWTGWQYGRDYTLSLYARADQPNARLGFIGWQHSSVPYLSQIPDDCVQGRSAVSQTWTRVSWTFQPVAEGPHRWQGPMTLGFFNCSSNLAETRLWLDAVQLEAGDRATPYRPDAYQAPAIDRKWLSDTVFKELKRRP